MMKDLIGRAGVAQQPATDMHDLARLVRALLTLDRDREGRSPPGGDRYDVVITGGGAEGRAVAAVLDEVQDGCGPVISDPDTGWLYWLVPPGSSRTWEAHPHAVCIGADYTLTLPAWNRTRPPGPYWLRLPAADRLVPAQPLRELLTRFRPKPEPHAWVAAYLSRNTPHASCPPTALVPHGHRRTRLDPQAPDPTRRQ
jgi:hypothetical protein